VVEKNAVSEVRTKPIPVADETSAPFWQAARDRRLVVQRCSACGYYNHPPRRVCDACLSQDLTFAPVSGKGKIFSFTIMHQRDVVGFENEAPFINLVVELDEQPLLLMVSDRPLTERDRVRIGAAVEVYFEDRGDGSMIPEFLIK
jgi:uncharacterized OB-fold protein